MEGLWVIVVFERHLDSDKVRKLQALELPEAAAIVTVVSGEIAIVPLGCWCCSKDVAKI